MRIEDIYLNLKGDININSERNFLDVDRLERTFNELEDFMDFRIDFKFENEEFKIKDISKLLQSKLSKIEIENLVLERGLETLNAGDENTYYEKRGQTLIIVEEGPLIKLLIDGGSEDRVYKIEKDFIRGHLKNSNKNKNLKKGKVNLLNNKVNLIENAKVLIVENILLNKKEDMMALEIEEIKAVHEEIEYRREEIKKETETLREKVLRIEKERREKRDLIDIVESRKKLKTIKNNIIKNKEEYINRIDFSRFESRDNVYLLLK